MARYEDRFHTSLVVTGTHYDMTTLLGQIIGKSSEIQVVHEPTNAAPALSHRSLAPQHWYEFSPAQDHSQLRQFLIDTMHGRDVLRVDKYALTEAQRALSPRRVVFQDPFLALAAADPQQRDGLKIVLSLRHPCGFVESLKRRGKGFDFANFVQPRLLDSLPDLADDIRHFAAERQPVLAQGALLWRVVYEFAARTYLASPLTLTVRQDDLIVAPFRVFLAAHDALGHAVHRQSPGHLRRGGFEQQRKLHLPRRKSIYAQVARAPHARQGGASVADHRRNGGEISLPALSLPSPRAGRGIPLSPNAA